MDEIRAEALKSGRGFVPSFDQSVAIILNPVGPTGHNIARISIAQVAFADLQGQRGLIRGRCETAWGQSLGGDIPFPRGNRWGTYFEYVCE